ncbi:MAG: glutamyl-tRNA reductase [Parachlamydiales bacterium]|nr:glutamyl-tRNA reductase [Parachlamydiales bacterium]
MLSIGVLGVNHKTANLPLREAIARGVSNLSSNAIFPYPTVLLSTCNRTEIYFSSEDLAEGHSHLLSYLRKQIDVPFEQAFYSFFGIDCFFHLCRVAAGLDSAIFAESEIQRQVRVAYSSASNLPASLHFVFQKALKVSKEVRSQQQQNGVPTLYKALWRLAEWQNKKILAVGYSQINRGFISFLLHKGVSQITLATRSPGNVDVEGIRVVDRSILSHWGHFDVIVCAGSSDGYLIQGQGHERHIIFDLSVPRNVDPNVGAKLYNIEQINQWIAEHQNTHLLGEAESMIWQNVIRLSRIYRIKTRRGLSEKYVRIQ